MAGAEGSGAVLCQGESSALSFAQAVPSIQVIPAQAEQLCCKTLPRLPVTAGKLPPTYCRALLAQPGWVAGFSFGLFWGFLPILSQGM